MAAPCRPRVFYQGGEEVRQTVELRSCDVCGKKMQKDGPIWYGGTVEIKEDYANANSYPHDEQKKDVCRECMKGVRSILKVVQFDDTMLTPEMEEMVERAVASMAREARR
jgi:hypothetical protein